MPRDAENRDGGDGDGHAEQATAAAGGEDGGEQDCNERQGQQAFFEAAPQQRLHQEQQQQGDEQDQVASFGPAPTARGSGRGHRKGGAFQAVSVAVWSLNRTR